MRRYLCSLSLSQFIRAIDTDSKFRFRVRANDQTHELYSCEVSKLQNAMQESKQFRDSVFEPMTSLAHPNSKFKKQIPLEILSSDQTLPTSQNPIFNHTNNSSITSPALPHYPSNRVCRSIPVLNFTDYPDNIIVWMYARKLLHNFGTRIRFRLDTYCGMIF